MLIDLLITEIHTGGAERCCTELAIYLNHNNHSVRVISIGPPPKGPTDELLWKKLLSNNVQTEFLNASNSLDLPRAVNKLRQLIHIRKPDIAQTFLWHANLIGAWCYGCSRIPVVAGARVVEPRRLRTAFAWTWRNCVQKVVCVSDEVAKWSSAYEGFKPEKLIVIPNGIKVPEQWKGSESIALNQASTEKILLFVGRLETQKGIDVLLDRTPSILNALPDHQLVLIGQGSWSKAWENWIAQSPLANRIKLLGRRSDVLDWMQRSSLLLLPTRYEGMPNVILEAMSVGLPVACTRVEGVEQLLGESSQDQTVSRNDWEAWEKLTIQLAKNPLTLERLSLENRNRAVSEFKLDDQLRKYELLYSEILGKIPLPPNTHSPA